jgi:hypothetical protein
LKCGVQEVSVKVLDVVNEQEQCQLRDLTRNLLLIQQKIVNTEYVQEDQVAVTDVAEYHLELNLAMFLMLLLEA